MNIHFEKLNNKLCKFLGYPLSAYQNYLKENKNKTLEAVSIGRNNNFDFIRFFAAALVIFSHSYLLLGFLFKEPYVILTGGKMAFASIAVDTFFLISGFLISKSYQYSKNTLDYFKKRFLRIYPALFVVIFLTLFILGPLITEFNIKEYFTNRKFFLYFINFSLFFQYDNLAGLFMHNPFEKSVNGSLWTLPHEMKCYLLVVVTGLLSFFKRRWLIFPFIISLILLDNGKPDSAYRLYPYFFIGQLFYLYRDKIILNKQIASVLLLLLILALSFKNPTLIYYLHYLILPYLTFYLAFNFKFFNNFGKCGDFSYGLYIYAFPIQQILVCYFHKYLNVYILTLSTFIFALIFAALSWHLVEKRALKLKNVNILDNIKNKIIKIFKLEYSISEKSL